MTEITRVPLKPVAKGSLTKLWLGVLGAVGIGAGLAVAAAPIEWGDVEVIEEVAASEPGGKAQRLTIETIVEGAGPTAQVGQYVFVNYKGFLEDGTQFDESQPIPWPAPGVFPEEGTPFPIEEGATVEGFYKGLQRVQKGGTYKLFIPSALGYGNEARPGSPIPPGSNLIFELEVVDIVDEAVFEEGMAINQRAFEASRPGPPPGFGE
ncbi:MAG: FKBP-type peptidyl-prolyl cis-trans isomerase [Erythrobacter sp.]|uniref:FKBP-type peptidyl-prolyl cis-trans isomerase n=1 Tax=Erythrobacter sp. TaxID=1042 RepID=UPI00260B4EFA|nr:FKBP-type peptidyl-prolyl cis-trans isomerase [Erythrobacter sp.]MDJ0979831.1 FKBP-type peptidyl-prolyl cis-trans isomerase [Erythrobacter sp.]